MIELLMVIVVISILTVMGVSTYRNWQQHVLLVNATDELKSALHLAQGKAIAAAQNNNWGVYLASDHYIIFPGSFYDQNNPDNDRRDFKGINIINFDSALSDGVGGYSSSAVFNKYTGTTVNSGNLLLAPASDYSITKAISIDLNGQTQ